MFWNAQFWTLSLMHRRNEELDYPVWHPFHQAFETPVPLDWAVIINHPLHSFFSEVSFCFCFCFLNLFERHSDGESKRCSACWWTPQRPAAAGVRPGWSQEPELLVGLPPQRQGARARAVSCECTWAGSWVWSGAGTLTQALWPACKHSRTSTCVATPCPLCSFLILLPFTHAFIW